VEIALSDVEKIVEAAGTGRRIAKKAE